MSQDGRDEPQPSAAATSKLDTWWGGRIPQISDTQPMPSSAGVGGGQVSAGVAQCSRGEGRNW